MKFLKPLLDTKLSDLQILDISYVVVLLPLLLILKVPMMLFAVIVIALLIFKKTPASNLLVLFVFVLGLVAVYLSLYGAFSFRGLSRLKLFLELLVYVLLIVVSMQRLTHKINFYLLISPFLFLALSLFFYHGMFMLFYVVFEVFFLLWMILAHRMNGELLESFRASMVMFMYSLPWVVVLFIFFPRISFEHATYGFKGENIQRMGHDGTMYLDSKALLVPSDRIVMEVGFEGKVPASHQLYFRGSVLYEDKKDHWEPLPHYIKRENRVFYATQGESIAYKVTLYPTQKRWIYMLDMPHRAVEESTLDVDLISTVKKEIKEPLHYLATSSLNHKYRDSLDEATRKASSTFYKERNPKTFQVAQSIKGQFQNIQQRADAIQSYFKAQNLTYSLKPAALDVNSSSDSFLFDKKQGYCVHFASAYVTMARMAGIPSRIVTGYKADLSNGMKDYLAVKERDAHAWAELYIDGHWVRVETTATASGIEADSLAQLNTQNTKKENALFKKVNLYLMYAKYQVETWILYYSHVRQLQLLEYAKNNPQFVFGFISALILLLVGTLLIINYFKRPRYSSQALESLQPLLKSLKKEGYSREKEETLHQFFLRYTSENTKEKEKIAHIKNVDNLYEQIVYGGDVSKETQKKLKRLAKKTL